MIEHADNLKALEDRYCIERELGRGGMATVYLARDLRHDRPVALKVLAPRFGHAIGPERFQREVLLMARLQHPHILPVLESGEADTTLWYTMPFVDGETLRDRLRRLKQLPLDEVARLTREIAAALDEAHRHGIVHRDIKPENVILTRGGHALVADFGIAKLLPNPRGGVPWETLTDAGLVMGTPEYMSPEQAGDGLVDARSDAYALGCLVYEMLTGEPPFSGPTAQSILAKRLAYPAPSPRTLRDSVPEDWDAAVRQALSRSPVDRHHTPGEFAAALTSGARTRSRFTFSRFMIIASAVVLASALGAIGLMHLTATTPPPDPRVVAILPFETGSPDTALQRLGRDLVFTLSATMDGVGDVRTADAHSTLTLVSGDDRNVTARSKELAKRLGAGRVIEGSLVREGQSIRAEAVVYTTGDASRIMRASVTLPADSIAPLTDSLTLRLIPSLVGGGMTANSLGEAFRTHSLPALRNFLDGEQRISQDRWPAAIASFSKAWSKDSTFWLAAARLAFALRWNNEEIPAVLQDQLHRHRDQLPPRERLEVEAHQALTDHGASASLAASRTLVSRFPESWIGWLTYGDVLFHNGPSLGEPLEAARVAFHRVMDLNPGLAPGWDHDALLAALDRDSVRLRTALNALEQMRPRPQDDYADKVLAFRLLDALVRHDSAAEAAAIDSMARDKVLHGRKVQTFYDPVRLGFPLSQIRLSRAVLVNGGSAIGEQELKLQIAQAFATAGQWDSAFAAAPTELDRYRFGVLAAAMGVVPWERAQSMRTQGSELERLFLDGVVAASTRDSRGASTAIARLSATGKPAGRLGADALRWLSHAAAGDSARAGRGLAALEWKLAEWNYRGVEALPILPPLDRIYAARWLAASGDRDQARRLLHWADSPFLIAPSMHYMSPVRPYLRQQLERLGAP